MEKRLINAIIAIILLMLPYAPLFAQQAESKPMRLHSAARRKPAKLVVNEAVSEKLPDTVDIDEEAVKNGLVITLAVERVTLFRCPVRPMQVLYGKIKTGIDLAAPLTNRAEVYIRPVVANIFTDMVIDMESGSFRLYVRTIA